ncbi:MAG: hypothetical protein HC858_01510 [Brachymonas sp.]|nr:hypothetical protein [Brachymonas sp.]NJS36413.1 hypothetical protein [Brachymonas sp.]
MRNITLSVDEPTYRTARIVAAEQGISVSALVRNYLQSLRPVQSTAAPMSLEETFNWAAQGYSAGQRLSREELYDRKAAREEAKAMFASQAKAKANP